MTWLPVMEYLCHKLPRICSTCPNTPRSFPHSWPITRFVTRLTRRVPLVEQELSSVPVHPISPPVLSGVRVARFLVLCVCFVDRCLSFCPFSFSHCVFCASSIYGFAPLVSSNSSQQENSAHIFWIDVMIFLFTPMRQGLYKHFSQFHKILKILWMYIWTYFYCFMQMTPS